MKPPPLRDDCFALPPGVDWTPVDEALARLEASLACVTGTESVQLPQADGRVLAEDVMAARSHPPRANSAVDGYGFAAQSLADTPVHRLPLVTGRAAAGNAYAGTVPAGAAIRILTGAVLPDGVDTVVLEEECTTDGKSVAFRGPVKPGANTRAAGEDVAKGQIVLPAGRMLRPQDLALLAATGHGKVPVRAQLRVGVLSTGDELAEAGDLSRADAVPDANRPMLAALVRRWGHHAIDLGRLADDRAVIRAALDAAAGRVDAIVTSGGASAGDEDHVSALLRAEGSLHAWRIAMKPGRPLALAMWKGVPVFGLPGNPVAAFVCALLFARPALGRLAGQGWLQPEAFTVPAGFSKTKKPGRREYLRARIGADGRAEAFRSEGSGRTSGLSWAGGLVELPDDALTVGSGDAVTFLPFSGFGL